MTTMEWLAGLSYLGMVVAWAVERRRANACARCVAELEESRAHLVRRAAGDERQMVQRADMTLKLAQATVCLVTGVSLAERVMYTDAPGALRDYRAWRSHLGEHGVEIAPPQEST